MRYVLYHISTIKLMLVELPFIWMLNTSNTSTCDMATSSFCRLKNKISSLGNMHRKNSYTPIRGFWSLELSSLLGPTEKERKKKSMKEKTFLEKGKYSDFFKKKSVKLNKTYFLTPFPLLMIGIPFLALTRCVILNKVVCKYKVYILQPFP